MKIRDIRQETLPRWAQMGWIPLKGAVSHHKGMIRICLPETGEAAPAETSAEVITSAAVSEGLQATPTVAAKPAQKTPRPAKKANPTSSE